MAYTQNYLQLKLLSIFVQQKEHYYGFKLLPLTTYTGISLDYNLAAANIDERKLLLDTNISANTTIITDKGFIGKDVTTSLKRESNVTLLTPLRKNMQQQMPAKFSATIRKVRKRIETTISQLAKSFNINNTKAGRGRGHD